MTILPAYFFPTFVMEFLIAQMVRMRRQVVKRTIANVYIKERKQVGNVIVETVSKKHVSVTVTPTAKMDRMKEQDVKTWT